MGDQWPSMRGRKLRQIIEKYCGAPVRHRSHRTYRGLDGRLFQFGYHDRREVTGGMVRRILLSDVGLDEATARKEAR